MKLKAMFQFDNDEPVELAKFDGGIFTITLLHELPTDSDIQQEITFIGGSGKTMKIFLTEDK